MHVDPAQSPAKKPPIFDEPVDLSEFAGDEWIHQVSAKTVTRVWTSRISAAERPRVSAAYRRARRGV